MVSVAADGVVDRIAVRILFNMLRAGSGTRARYSSIFFGTPLRLLAGLRFRGFIVFKVRFPDTSLHYGCRHQLCHLLPGASAINATSRAKSTTEKGYTTLSQRGHCWVCDDGTFMSFSSPSKRPVRQGFPAIFEVGVRDPLRRVVFCPFPSTGGSLH